MHHATMKAFITEMESIEKDAGIGSFLAKGFRGLGHLASGKMKLTGKQGLTGVASKAYKRGGGGWGGVKNVARSQAGRMAGGNTLTPLRMGW